MSPSPFLRSVVHHSRRWLSTTSTRRAVTKFQMPAMSPTMTEGGIASWKKQEGESFTSGDVLLEIETDKATIDVEAQDDGIVGKILVQDGEKGVPVGKVIALLAEEGDDISNLEIPKDEPAPSQPASAPKEEAPAPAASAPPPTPKASHHVSHSRPLFPSVARLLQEHGVEDAERIKGTGVRGMLTKGDVLAFLGKASSPTGTFKVAKSGPGAAAAAAPKKAGAKAEKPLDGLALRQLIVQGIVQAQAKKRAAAAPPIVADFDSVIADYLPTSVPAPSTPPTLPPKPKSSGFLDGLV
ncbi:single hybrid motif-containing protein [Gloeopeniophorella convolvens]|nr:single hybrid motif-containing protein [Gloeopeniophorella convolvens]